MEDGKPKTFVSEDAARKWLIENDENFNRIPMTHLIDYYNIKPYVVQEVQTWTQTRFALMEQEYL